MATVSFSDVEANVIPAVFPSTEENSESPELHRIDTVRLQQRVSVRTAARQMGLDMRSVRHQEQPTTDLRLSDLYRWQRVLDVPLVDLLLDPGMPLSRPVMERARMVRLMKTAAAIQETAESESVQRMALNLIDQLIEIMPELEEVNAWHAVGQRRSMNEYGRAMEQTIPDHYFGSMAGWVDD